MNSSRSKWEISEQGLSTSPNFQIMRKDKGEEMELSMQDIVLTGVVQPTGARLLVRHVFAPAGDRPVELVYAMMLPRDAALRRFRIVGERLDAKSELRPVKDARRAYERALEQGHLSVLAQQYRDGYVNLDVGNVRPGERVAVYLEVLAGVDLYDDGFRFRFPFTLAPCYHPHMRAAALDSETGELEFPEAEFGDLLLPPFKRDASVLHSTGFSLLLCLPQDIAKIESPSHPIRVDKVDSRRARVHLATDRDLPNRDLVLDARMTSSFSGVLCGTAPDQRMHFAAIIASDRFGKTDSVPRRVVFLVDRSGSMGGLPLQQAKNAVLACVGALSEEDLVGLVVFDNRTELYDSKLVPACRSIRQKLRQYVDAIDARGGTELLAGIQTAISLLGDQGGDIFVLTDGQVAATEPIIQNAKAPNVRVHCLGIGSASQDRFLTQLARETGGVSRFLTPRERVDWAAVELFASIGKPVATNVRVRLNGCPDCTIAPTPPRIVYSGHPLIVLGESAPSRGEIVIEWSDTERSKSITLPVDADPGVDGSTLRLLRGARLVTDLESQVVPDFEGHSGQRRKTRRAELLLKKLGREYGLANRYWALVAVVQRAGDRTGVLPETRVIPVGMPEDVWFGAYFPSCPRVSEEKPRLGPVPSIQARSPKAQVFETYVPSSRWREGNPKKRFRPHWTLRMLPFSWQASWNRMVGSQEPATKNGSSPRS